MTYWTVGRFKPSKKISVHKTLDSSSAMMLAKKNQRSLSNHHFKTRVHQKHKTQKKTSTKTCCCWIAGCRYRSFKHPVKETTKELSLLRQEAGVSCLSTWASSPHLKKKQHLQNWPFFPVGAKLQHIQTDVVLHQRIHRFKSLIELDLFHVFSIVMHMSFAIVQTGKVFHLGERWVFWTDDFTVQKVDENGAISWNNQGDDLLGRDSMKHFPVNSKRDLEKSLLTAAWRCDWTSGAPRKCFPNARLNMEDHEVPLCTSQSWKGNNGKTRQALNLLFGICKVHLQGWRSKILKNQNNFAGKHLESIFIERQELDFFPQLRNVASSGHGAIICCLHTDSSTAITHSRL